MPDPATATVTPLPATDSCGTAMLPPLRRTSPPAAMSVITAMLPTQVTGVALVTAVGALSLRCCLISNVSRSRSHPVESLIIPVLKRSGNY